MRDYREKTVRGMVFDAARQGFGRYIPMECSVTVRMTSDKRGQSLSLQANNVMIEIPLESVANIIKVTERNDKESE